MYTIRHSIDPADLELGRIDLAPWGGEYRPEAMYKIGYSDRGLQVYLRCYEVDPVADVLERNGNVCRDSCMEFFFSPSADLSNGYFNFELNANPTLLLHYGLTARVGRCCVEWPIEDFDITVTKKFDDFGRRYWQLSFTAPWAMMAKYIPGFEPLKAGDIIRANLYKCGSTRQTSHYLTAFPFDTEKVPRPDFHVPDQFGQMILG